MTRGIVIIATDNPYYGALASNLCCAIKSTSKESVCLIHDEKAIDGLDALALHQFDIKVPVSGGAFSLKLELFDLSPFDKTLYLDADMTLSPFAKLSKFMDDLDGVNFTMANRGVNHGGTVSDWVDVANAMTLYEVKTWIDCSSEVIYFEKQYPAKEVFDYAKLFYKSNEVVHRTIGGHQPDEPAFSYAMAYNDVKPHKMPWLPSFWEPQERRYKSEQTIQEEYTFISMGGNSVSERIRKMYKRWSQYYCSQLGVKWHPHVNKKDIKALNRQAI